MPSRYWTDVTLVSEDEDEDDKIDDDVGYLVRKVIQSRKLSSDESYNSQRSDIL